jgi:hypothetical protein
MSLPDGGFPALGIFHGRILGAVPTTHRAIRHRIGIRFFLCLLSRVVFSGAFGEGMRVDLVLGETNDRRVGVGMNEGFPIE